MGIADRITLTLYTFFMAIFSVIVILFSLGVFPHETVHTFIQGIEGDWVFAIGGVIILLVSLRLLISGLGLTASSSLLLSESDKGKVHVGKAALENYIVVLAQEIYGIHNVKVIVKFVEKGIDVRINTSIEPGINIPATSKEIEANVKESIKKVAGIDVVNVEIYFKQIQAKEG
ncbi:MAG: alkaline shock response membrane anchor protein AmaP [Phascolarctobacterium sp.]|nr:alkaline shock response membrane anchor protein AmaP [Phascolarctobacterium sp.]